MLLIIEKIWEATKKLLCKNDGCVIFRWPGAALPAAVEWPVKPSHPSPTR
jgi:hypothetical protein